MTFETMTKRELKKLVIGEGRLLKFIDGGTSVTLEQYDHNIHLFVFHGEMQISSMCRVYTDNFADILKELEYRVGNYVITETIVDAKKFSPWPDSRKGLVARFNEKQDADYNFIRAEELRIGAWLCDKVKKYYVVHSIYEHDELKSSDKHYIDYEMWERFAVNHERLVISEWKRFKK